MTENKILSVSPPLAQIYLRKLAMWGSSYLGNCDFFLKQYVDMAINEYGEERIVQMLKSDESENKIRNREIGNNWEEVMRKFKNFDKAIYKVKGYYDKIENKKFSKIDKSDVREFLKFSKKAPLIKQEIYTLAVFLIKNSGLQRMTIGSDSWKIVERTHKIIGQAQKKPQDSLSQPNQEVEVFHED